VPQPRFPIYIVSKGRADSRLTARALDRMGVPYFVVIEAQEHDAYAAVIDPTRLLVLDRGFQDGYLTCDRLGAAKSKGPGPARNFAWSHATENGHAWHWVMDDNIRGFTRLFNNRKHPMGDGTGFHVMESFCLRYENVAMAGPNYFHFAKRKQRIPPFITNTRIYSCNLIRNDTPFYWRGRYNEDTDLSLRMLKSGFCTIQFNAFLQVKSATQTVAGGNTREFYEKEGTVPKSRMLYELHPDVTRLIWRFGRAHHYVDYRRFRNNRLKLRAGVEIDDVPNEFGLHTVARDSHDRGVA
jgi:hypothetical protein